MGKLNQLRESAHVQTTKSIENYVNTFLKKYLLKQKMVKLSIFAQSSIRS